MNGRNFSLSPFAPASPRPDLRITGGIARRAQILAISYELRGRLADVALPPAAARPARRPGLWQETCFEFFLGVKHTAPYWEFNLSPAGHWNVYRFAGYRQGRQEEAALAALPFSVRIQPEALLLTLEADLAGLVPAAAVLEVGISAVIRARDGEATYWALSHPGPQPDFHRRESFSLHL